MNEDVRVQKAIWDKELRGAKQM